MRGPLMITASLALLFIAAYLLPPDIPQWRAVCVGLLFAFGGIINWAGLDRL